jgi:glycosyltransferase 2 family protein
MTHHDPTTNSNPTPSWRELLRWLREKIHIRGWHLALGVGLSGLFLWLAFREVPLSAIADDLGALDWAFLLLALGVSVASTLARAARWRLLYYPHQNQVALMRLTGLLFISQMVNFLIPARVGELVRIVLLRSVSGSRTLGTIAVEKLLDLLALLAFLLILPFTVTLPAWFKDSSQGFMLLALVLFGLTLVLFFIKDKLLTWLSALLRFLPAGWQERFQRILRQALTSLDVFRDPWLGLRLSGWSFLVWGMGVVLNYLLFHAFRLTLPISAALFLLLVLQVGISVPSIPGKLGVFQYLTILALVPFGVDRGMGLSYSLVLYLVVFGPHLVFGVIFGVGELALVSQQHPVER